MLRTAEEHATRPRAVVVTSELHFWATFDKQVVDGNKIYESLNTKEYCTPSVMSVRYQISKLYRLVHAPVIIGWQLPERAKAGFDSQAESSFLVEAHPHGG
ncbi:hypothetical protein FPV67DRAFT_584844 [Lyophyllum atratum]|nr:hypothetical protein FPV67DRAFT_584844 [Lyophyllum atratum]